MFVNEEYGSALIMINDRYIMQWIIRDIATKINLLIRNEDLIFLNRPVCSGDPVFAVSIKKKHNHVRDETISRNKLLKWLNVIVAPQRNASPLSAPHPQLLFLIDNIQRKQWLQGHRLKCSIDSSIPFR